MGSSPTRPTHDHHRPAGLPGCAFGALTRDSAGARAAHFGLLFASTAIIDLLRTQWRNDATLSANLR